MRPVAELGAFTRRVLGPVGRPLVVSSAVSLGVHLLVPILTGLAGFRIEPKMWHSLLISVGVTAAEEALLHYAEASAPEVRLKYVSIEILTLYEKAAANPDIERRLVQASIDLGFDDVAVRSGILMAKQLLKDRAA